jgi:hypothetical protein
VLSAPIASGLAISCLLRSIRSLSDCELATVRRVQLLDQVVAREWLSREMLLGRLHGLGVPIHREAVDGNSRIIDRVSTTVRRVKLVNETLLRKGLRAQVLVGFFCCALLLLRQGGADRCWGWCRNLRS